MKIDVAGKKFHHAFVPSVAKQLVIFTLLFPTVSQDSWARSINLDLCLPDLLTIIELGGTLGLTLMV